MLDHVGIAVSDYARAKAFYTAVLAPLGYGLVMETSEADAAGFGPKSKPIFWIGKGKPADSPVHVAFAAENRAAVDAFYKAALGAGAKDNGPPGIRAHYHPDYYGAFVLGPDGANVEAVCHKAA